MLMENENSSFRPGHFTQLVTHLDGFSERRRDELAALYEAPGSEAAELAEFWIQNPDRVVEVIGDELDSSLEWRIVEEGAVEHDLRVGLDWAPARGRQKVSRLGLMEPALDHTGHYYGVMPGGLAAILAPRVRGDRGSLLLLLGRQSDDEVSELAEQWDIDDRGSKVEVILRICDHFEREEMIDDILGRLPDPDWIGDALMILELGGISHWRAVYGYDLEDNLGGADNVVPLMRDNERRTQRQIAETLMELGVLFRLEGEGDQEPMIAVPEALWPGLWKLGRRWLMDWNQRSVKALRERGTTPEADAVGPGLQPMLKWWLCEAEDQRLRWDHDGETTTLTDDSCRRLDSVYSGDADVEWNDLWHLGKELQIVVDGSDGVVEAGPEAEGLLDERRSTFIRQVLLEWCVGYAGRGADTRLVEAIGLDETWRSRAVGLLRRRAEPVPVWMHEEGVDAESTGGGWLRHSGTGQDEMVLFEAGLVMTFVVMMKVLWLDLLSVLDGSRQLPIEGLVRLMQNAAGLSMFGQLRLVLEEQPAPVYLPFQRASLLMDDHQASPIRTWVEELIERLLVPLGVASLDNERGLVTIDTDVLRIEDPPGWPSGQREKLLREIFGTDIDFESDTGRTTAIREVADRPDGLEAAIPIEEPVARLRAACDGRSVASFDGVFIEFESESDGGPS